MEIVIPFLFLFLSPVYLGLKYFSDYGDNAIDGLGISERVAATLFIIYIAFVLFIGKETLYGLIIGNDFRKFAFYFIFPSVGFGIAMFPKTFAEFFSNYVQLAETSSLRTVRIFGWMILIIFAISLFAYATM